MHFTVGVITKSGTLEEVERLLAPYDENMEVETYVYKSKESIIEETKDDAESLRLAIKKYSEGDEEVNPYWIENRHVNPPKMRDVHLKLLLCKTDDDYYNYYRGDYDNYDEEGNELTTYNPDSKWDWYSIGGRWDGSFDKENGKNTLLIKDIKWDDSTEEEKEYHKRFWEINVEEQPLKEGEDKMEFFNLYKKEYYIERYHTKEEYVERVSKNYTYAVLTSEGEWVAPGEVSWFSTSEDSDQQREYENWFYKYMEEHPDYYFTLVDCHI